MEELKNIFLCILYTEIIHAYIFSGVRPFGVSLLLAGWDEDEERPYLYQCDPSVSHPQLF